MILYSKIKLQSLSKLVRRFPLIAASAMTFGLASCTTITPLSSESSPGEASPTATADELQVITTFLPITQFTRAVAGDRVEVNQLLPTNVGPHDFQARPEDVQRLAQADVLVKNGLEMEAFLEDLVTNANNQNLQIIDSSQGIATIANEAVEGHSHAEDHSHAHDHAEGEEQSEAGHHHHGQFNPHIWLDPKRAIQQVENIRDGLIAADPEGKAEYTANAAAFIAQLKELDAEITSTLQPYAGKTFVAFHDFAPYFAQSYGLKAEFLVDIPEGNPSPEDVRRVTEQVQAADLKAILTEPQAGEGPFSALANDLNIKVSTFDPLETGGDNALEPEYYLTTMRQNMKSLVTAFGGSTQSFLPLWKSGAIAIIPQKVGVRF